MTEPKFIETDGGVGLAPSVVDKGRTSGGKVHLDPQADRITLGRFHAEAAKTVNQAND